MRYESPYAASALASPPFALGKVPSEREFVRVGATPPAAQALDGWLADAMNRLRAAGYHGLPRAVRLVVPVAGDRLVACVVVPSSDAVLRAYPMVVGVAIDPDAYASEVALGLDRYLSDAEAWVGTLAEWPAGTLHEAFAQVHAPTAAEIATARASLAQTLESHSSADLDGRLFGDAPGGAVRRDAALRALRMAADEATRTGRPVFVSCPVVIDVDLFAWLVACERAGLFRRGTYGVAFCEEPTPRLILAFGRPDGQLLQFALADDRNARSFWPLMDVADALPAAVPSASVGPHPQDGIGTWLSHAARVLGAHGRG